MKVSFYNIGCKVNFAEAATISGSLSGFGARAVPFGSPADIIIINTCTVTCNADADSRKIIRRAHRQFPEAYIVVMGCYAQLHPEEIEAIEGANLVLGNGEKFDLERIIEAYKSWNNAVYVDSLEAAVFHFASSEDNQVRTRINIKLQDGCDYYCTYCAVAHARGPSRSMSFQDLRNYLEGLRDKGFREVILSGINLGTYKTPTGEDFADVLQLIDRLLLPQRFRISSIEPNLVTDRIIEIVARSRSICPHFHIPLQSGADDILKAMKRRYNSARFAKVIHKIHDAIPDCGIGIDVITGFPGETDEHHRQTYELLNSLPITYLHVFTYSERSGTEAYGLPNHVPHAKRKTRTRELSELSENKSQEFYRKCLGRTYNVLPETEYKKKAESGNGLWTGWTDNYIPVLFVPDGHELQQVKLMDIEQGKVRAETL